MGLCGMHDFCLCVCLYAELEEKLSIMSGEAESQERRATRAEEQGRSSAGGSHGSVVDSVRPLQWPSCRGGWHGCRAMMKLPRPPLLGLLLPPLRPLQYQMGGLVFLPHLHPLGVSSSSPLARCCGMVMVCY